MALSWRNFASRIGMDPEPHPRPPAHVLRLQPYRCVSSRKQIEERPDTEAYKLDWNESTIAPSPGVQQALTHVLSNGANLNWYPDLAAEDLTEALETYTGIPRDSLIVTNGSDDALLLLCRTYLRSGNEVLVPVPTYTHFLVHVGAQNARIIELRNPNPFANDLNRLERAITGKTKMVYLVSPNNPTGTMWTARQIDYLCSRHPNVMFVVDEAYHEFSGQSVIHLTQTYSNLAVTRTFSKAFGLAAFRVGYVAAHPRACGHMWRLHNPKSVNTFGQLAATAAVHDLPYLESYVDEVRAARTEFVSRIRELGFEIHDSVANFVVVRVPQPHRFTDGLEEHNIYIRDRSSMPGLSGCVRITIGTREQMDHVFDCIKQVVTKLGWLKA